MFVDELELGGSSRGLVSILRVIGGLGGELRERMVRRQQGRGGKTRAVKTRRTLFCFLNCNVNLVLRKFYGEVAVEPDLTSEMQTPQGHTGLC